MLDVNDKGKLNTLSFSQQKKFIIAFALACYTKMLLLDKPKNGLDIPSKIQFRKLISSVFTEDKMIFISTHQIRDLDNLIDNVIIVDNGELLLQASLSEIEIKLSFKIVDAIISVTGVNTRFEMNKLKQKSITVNMSGKSKFEVESLYP